MMRRWAALPVAAALITVATGCGQFGTSQIDLVRDRSIAFTTDDHDELHLPFELAWRDDEAGPGRHYAVIVNRTLPPGESLRWFAKGDTACLAQPTCPDATYLLRKGVIRTDTPTVQISAVPVPAGRSDRAGTQTATVVVLDDDDRRVGEAAFVFEFTLDEASQ